MGTDLPSVKVNKIARLIMFSLEHIHFQGGIGNWVNGVEKEAPSTDLGEDVVHPKVGLIIQSISLKFK